MTMRNTRRISWVRAARKSFEQFPASAREDIRDALTLAAEGHKPDIAKPMRGLGTGVFEIALKHRADAYRIVYVLQVRGALWVLHAFQKKATQGRKTPKREIDLVRSRIKRLKRELG